MTKKKTKEIVEVKKKGVKERIFILTTEPKESKIPDVMYLVSKKKKHQKPRILPTEEKIDEKTWEHKKDTKISLKTDKRSVSWLNRIPMSYELVFEMGLKLLKCPYSEYCPAGIEKSKQRYLDAVKKSQKKGES